MKKIKIVDFQSINDFHEMINLSIAIICNNIFEETIYKSGKSSNQNIKKLYESNSKNKQRNSNIKFIPKYVYDYQNK